MSDTPPDIAPLKHRFAASVERIMDVCSSGASDVDHDFADILAVVTDRVFDAMDRWYNLLCDPVHDLEHGVTVVGNTAEILEGTAKVDSSDVTRDHATVPAEVHWLVFGVSVILSAGFHDVRDHKHMNMGTPTVSEEDLRDFVADIFRHIRGTECGKRSKYFTRTYTVFAARDAVLSAIDRSSWSKRAATSQWISTAPSADATLTRILQDADWLEAIGTGGIQRCIDWSRKTMPSATDAEIRARVCAHIEEKLIKIPDTLSYAKSREIAKDRVQVMRDYMVGSQ